MHEETTDETVTRKHLLVYPLENEQFERSFEAFAEQVSNWPGMFFEMDGSFVWAIAASVNNSPGQLDGMLYDRVGRIEYLDLKGTADCQQWLEVCAAMIDSPQPVNGNGTISLSQRLRIYDVAKGCFVTPEEAFEAR